MKHHHAAWRAIVADYGWEIADQVANEAVAEGQHVPQFVRELIAAARNAAIEALHAADKQA